MREETILIVKGMIGLVVALIMVSVLMALPGCDDDSCAQHPNAPYCRCPCADQVDDVPQVPTLDAGILPDGGSEDLPFDAWLDATYQDSSSPSGSDSGAQSGGSDDGGTDVLDGGFCNGRRGIGSCVSDCVHNGSPADCCVRVCKEECRP